MWWYVSALKFSICPWPRSDFFQNIQVEAHLFPAYCWFLFFHCNLQSYIPYIFIIFILMRDKRIKIVGGFIRLALTILPFLAKPFHILHFYSMAFSFCWIFTWIPSDNLLKKAGHQQNSQNWILQPSLKIMTYNIFLNIWHPYRFSSYWRTTHMHHY